MKMNKVGFAKSNAVNFAKKIWVVIPVATVALSACVTINIYFPAAAAEKAADKIIEEVWKQTDKPVTPDVKEKK